MLNAKDERNLVRQKIHRLTQSHPQTYLKRKLIKNGKNHGQLPRYLE